MIQSQSVLSPTFVNQEEIVIDYTRTDVFNGMLDFYVLIAGSVTCCIFACVGFCKTYVNFKKQDAASFAKRKSECESQGP